MTTQPVTFASWLDDEIERHHQAEASWYPGPDELMREPGSGAAYQYNAFAAKAAALEQVRRAYQQYGKEGSDS